MSVYHVDRFSAGLDDLTRKQQGDYIEILRVLKRTGRFSTFEASDNATIARTMDRLTHKGLTTVDPDGTRTVYGKLIETDHVTFGYPWTKVTLTPAAERLLAAKDVDQAPSKGREDGTR